jgi:hypothetical protein
MRRACVVALTLALVLGPAGLWAEGPVDLAKVDRKIDKEPAYKSKAPKYCLMVFGLEGKSRVWLVQDGDTIYVDRNGNGDLTEPGEAVKTEKGNEAMGNFTIGDLKLGGLTHTGVSVTRVNVSAEMVGNDDEWQRLKKTAKEPSMWWVSISAERDADDTRELPKKINYIINGDGAGMLVFGDSAKDAPVLHINGPFTLALQDRRQFFVAGEKRMFLIGVGPQGIGPGTFAFIRYPNTIPATVYPEAEIAFPARSRSQEPIKKKYVLKERC